MAEQQNDNTPDWVRQHNLQHDAKEREENERLQRQLEDGEYVRENSPLFWQQLVKALSTNTDALKSLKGEHLDGNTSPSDGGGEKTCFIQVIQRGPHPEPTRMNLFYKPGDSRIRCWYEDQDAGDIDLVRRADVILAVPQRSIRMSAETLAEHLVREMVRRVKGRRERSYV